MNSNKEIKAIARKNLENRYSQTVFIIMSYCIINALIVSLVPISTKKSIWIILSIQVLILIANTFSQICKCGVYNYFIKQSYNIPSGNSDLFYFFSHNQKTAFIYSLACQIIFSLCTLPQTLFLFFQTKKTLSNVCISILIYIAGVILYFLIYISFSQIIFLLSDFPNRSFKELLKLSFWLMKGQKLRYIKLVISFIPLLFVSALTLGIGLIWVIPYMYSTYTAFYIDLSSAKAK